MKKILVNLLCSIVPSKKLRHKIRDKYYKILYILEKKFENKINSKKYWDYRFSSKDWSNLRGDEQTKENVIASLRILPDEIKDEINKNCKSIVDFGCALGDGSPILKNAFKELDITGVDISSKGIKNARKVYKDYNYIACDLTKSNYKFDVLYSSNTFEHFFEPFDILEKLTKNIEKYFIIITLYNQVVPLGEHVSLFNEKNIKKNLSNNFELIYFKSYKIHDVIKPEDCLFYRDSNFDQFIFIYKKI